MNSRMRLAFGQLSASGALVVVLVGYLMVRQPMLAEDVKAGQQTAVTQQKQIDAQQAAIDANKAALSDANRRLVALGKPPVPVPPVPPQVHQDEFTAEEAAAVRLIVAEQIARSKTPITQAEISQIAKTAALLVPKPADGKTPTPAELQMYAKVAVASYCLEDRCVRNGKDGDKGEKGDPAPKVTDEELLRAAQTALVAYCGQETKPCTPKDGVDGKDAPPPFSVVDQDCVGDGEQSYWKTYLSNGSEQRVITGKGPCRVGSESKADE